MPAAAKLLADNNLSASAVAGTGKDGRVTKGDALAAVAGGVQVRRLLSSPPACPPRHCPRWQLLRLRKNWATALSSACP